MAQEPARTRALGLIAEEVLAHVPGFTVGGAAWATRLPGGTMNASFMVETGAGRFVVRIQNEAAAALGADHEREATLHATAAAAGLAPALIYVGAGHVDDVRAAEMGAGHAAEMGAGHAAETGAGRVGETGGARGGATFMVMEHVGDDVWSLDDMGRPERLMQLGATLQRLHSLTPPSVAPFEIGASIERLHERLYAALPSEAAQLSQLIDRAREALLASGSAQRPKTAIHNDLHHTNLIGAARLWLVDWEYAAVTDPLLDLACVLAYYPRAAAHTDVLLDSSRLADRASPGMLRATTWLFMLVSYFWYRTRRLTRPVSAQELASERELLARLA